MSDKWDEQIENDTKAGKLDKLSNQALADYEAGNTRIMNEDTPLINEFPVLDETLFREGHPDELFFNVECPNCGLSHDYVIQKDTAILVAETNRYVCYVVCENCTHEFEVNLSP